jgi:flagellar biosynthesis GTPase FlhF
MAIRFYARIFLSLVPRMKTQDLKKIVDKYDPARLAACIRQQVEKGGNACEVVDENDEVIAFLSKAEVVRELMDQGMTFSEALRELGKRIRAVYGKDI